jgi:phospholipase C
MTKDLSKIRTIVIAMLENRSFDHILGYLGLPEFGHPRAARIEGIQHANLYYAHDTYPPRPLEDHSLNPDPPHERENIAIQINGSLSGPMKGFVESYQGTFEKLASQSPHPRLTGVMEYCTQDDIPTTDFLARNFAICDNWFAPLPASTLPNRLTAMSGYALVDHTPNGYMDDLRNLVRNNPHDLLYGWLDGHSVSWRVYHQGTPFFKQMPRVFERFEQDFGAGNVFRSLDALRGDVLNADVPQVVFVEPRYQDDPYLSGAQATDDHPPASLWGGQSFLKIVYDALTANKEVWKGLVLLVTYDEHGAFFDHVPPRSIPTAVPPGASYTQGFLTTGARVPGLVVSPFVKGGDLYEGVLDHTSILKFMGEMFGDGRYSPIVDARPIESVADALDSELLTSTEPISDPPQP